MPEDSNAFDRIKPILRVLDDRIEEARRRRLRTEDDDDDAASSASTPDSAATSDDEPAETEAPESDPTRETSASEGGEVFDPRRVKARRKARPSDRLDAAGSGTRPVSGASGGFEPGSSSGGAGSGSSSSSSSSSAPRRDQDDERMEMRASRLVRRPGSGSESDDAEGPHHHGPY